MTLPSRETLEKYADLCVKTGVNLQKGQRLMINAPIEGAEFVRVVVEKAYENGAKDVHVNWQDDTLSLLKFKHAADEVLQTVPEWTVQLYDWIAEGDGAVLSVHATDPDLLKEVDPTRVAMAQKASGEALKNFREYTMNDRITWSVISIPTEAWAKKVFNEQDGKRAVEKLWDEILKIVRVDQEDPIQAWAEHNATLLKATEILNEKAYKSLVFTAPGTDLEIELPKGHLWKGGSAFSEKGTVFNPNMPTEEAFTMPHKYGVNGYVTSTKPLNYGGSLIDRFTLTFEDGQVVDYKAEVGEDVLSHLLKTDEGAKRLGEVALVPHESPVSQSGLIFYNTLFDENASCHVALGKAYPTNIEGGSEMTEDQLDEHGVNDSLTHVDFMIGSEELNIDGITKDGEKEAVFRNGTWALDIS